MGERETRLGEGEGEREREKEGGRGRGRERGTLSEREREAPGPLGHRESGWGGRGGAAAGLPRPPAARHPCRSPGWIWRGASGPGQVATAGRRSPGAAPGGMGEGEGAKRALGRKYGLLWRVEERERGGQGVVVEQGGPWGALCPTACAVAGLICSFR